MPPAAASFRQTAHRHSRSHLLKQNSCAHVWNLGSLLNRKGFCNSRQDKSFVEHSSSTVYRLHTLRAIIAPKRRSQTRLLAYLKRTEVTACSTADKAAMGRAANGTAESGHSRSGLLVAQQVLQEKLDNGAKAIIAECERLRRARVAGTFHAALSGGNERRNRYSNVLPFDANRVLLQRTAGHDYINASLLQSPETEQPPWRYIATQGPEVSTIGDFWQMVYESGSCVIVMLTCNVECGSIRKCAEYFPEEPIKSAKYKGGWAVTCTAIVEVDSDVRQRQLVLTPPSPDMGPPHEVTHFHYHAWPDHGVPSTTQPLRDLVAATQRLHKSIDAPPIVHCSAGIGRTGTFCTVDIALRRLKAGSYGTVVSAAELKPIVAELRRQRAGMVQTLDQYIFCYQAVKDEVDSMRGCS